jgi:hypothetical protein
MSADESSLDANDAVGWYDDHAEAMVKRHEYHPQTGNALSAN